MKTTRHLIGHRNKQQGAALVIGLMLLVVITVLAVSGMRTATTGLAMARNDQNYEFAFQAAETGLENALASGPFPTVPETDLGTNVISANDSVATRINYQNFTIVPPDFGAYSLGGGVVAHRFTATATAESLRAPGSTSDRDAPAIHTQSFYVVGAEPPPTF